MKPHIIDDKGKRLFIELGTHIQLEIKGMDLSLKSELIGMEVGKYLILKSHQVDDDKLKLLKKNKIVAKYLHKHVVLGFQTKAISIISDPENIIFLEYPEIIENYNIRTEQRFHCFFPVKVEIAYNIVEGIILDINVEGCCCMVKDLKIFDEQSLDKIVLYLQDMNMKNELALLGKIKSIRRKKDELHIGIMFDKMNSSTPALIEYLFPTLEFQAKTSILTLHDET